MRLAATSALISRKDTIIVASVSAIYGLGDPEDYSEMKLSLAKDMEIPREKLIRHLVDMQYSRNDMDFSPGHFRVRGDVIELFPTYESGTAIHSDQG